MGKDTVWVLVSGDSATFRGVAHSSDALKNLAQRYETSLANNREASIVILEWEQIGDSYRSRNEGIIFGKYLMWKSVVDE